MQSANKSGIFEIRPTAYSEVGHCVWCLIVRKINISGFLLIFLNYWISIYDYLLHSFYIAHFLISNNQKLLCRKMIKRTENLAFKKFMKHLKNLIPPSSCNNHLSS